ncbi:MAG: DMT family protein [Polyangiaceae bacterium]|nr:DMT family protein [Polyangiaceae bacterium]
MPALLPIVLLCISNVFMTFAWYGHLKFKSASLFAVIVVSWGIAFIEYCFAVPANRIGHGTYSAAQLKTIQEIITLAVFAAFSALYLREPLGWRQLVGFGFVALGGFFVFQKG